jgi:glyoxylase-like metal-dependent hydrolase (beta-lactamase superfamily II)
MLQKMTVGILDTNCYISDCKDGAIIFDPGANSSAIIKKLDALKLIPRYICLTHGHYDHVAAVPGLIEHYAAIGINPVIVIHKDDNFLLGKDAYKPHCDIFISVAGNTSFVDSVWKDLPDAGKIVEEGSVIEQFKIIHVPGHSEGSVAYYYSEKGILIIVYTLFLYGVGRTDLPGSNYEQLEKSLHRLFKLPPETEVYPGHGQSTTIGSESRLYS